MHLVVDCEDNEDQIWIILTFDFNILLIQTFNSECFYDLSLVILVYTFTEDTIGNIFLPKQAVGYTRNNKQG